MNLNWVLMRPVPTMSSSITCCAAMETPLRDDAFQSSYESYGNAIHGLKSDVAERGAGATRRKREFTPEEQKDDTYWLKRSRNNESAKRSRLRRRMEECLLESRAVELLRENEKLKAALSAMHYHNISVYQRDRNLGCHLGIPACQSGNTNIPVPYEMCQGGGGTQSHVGPNMNFSFSGPFPLSQMVVPRDPRLAELQPSFGPAHVQAPEAYGESSGSVISQAKDIGNEIKPTEETERASVLPLLPYKLRYKVSKAWHGNNHWETIQPPPVQKVWE